MADIGNGHAMTVTMWGVVQIESDCTENCKWEIILHVKCTTESFRK